MAKTRSKGSVQEEKIEKKPIADKEEVVDKPVEEKGVSTKSKEVKSDKKSASEKSKDDSKDAPDSTQDDEKKSGSETVAKDTSSLGSSIDESDKSDKEGSGDDKKDDPSTRASSVQGKEKESEKDPDADENGDGIVSSREAINEVDPDVKVTEPTKEEVLVQKITQQIDQNSEYFVFRLRKSVIMLVFGLLIVALWVVPVALFLSDKFGFSIPFMQRDEQVVSVEATPTPEPVVEKIRIRIKSAENSERVLEMQQLLQSAGFEDIDFEAGSVEENGVTVSVKTGSDQLLSDLLKILEADYSASTSSSELTSDSDFSAVIFTGE